MPLVAAMKTHFAARTLEWFGAAILFSWGYYYVTHPQLLTDPATATMFSKMDDVAGFFHQGPLAIGAMAITTGIVRAAALFVNGAYSKTPLIRLVTAFASAFIWTNIVIGFALTQRPNTGVVMYSWMVIADVVSGYRAGYDLVIAENTYRRVRSLNGHDDSRVNGSFSGLVRRFVFPHHT